MNAIDIMSPASAPSRSGNRSIGAILIDTGKLTVDSAEHILHFQKENGLQFGDAALRLGLLTEQDIQFALARQYDYPYLLAGEGRVSEELVAAYAPFSPQVEGLRALRSQLMLRWFTDEAERKTLAIVSPGRSEGRSYLAANLAVVFSQLGEHTLLIDADLRNPRQHQLFGLENRSGLSSILSHRGDACDVQRIPSFVDLSVLPSGPLPPNPQELLGRPIFAKLMDEFSREFDVVILDTPAASDCADGHTVAVRASGALLVARKHQSSLGGLGAMHDALRRVGVQVVGSVVSEF